MDIITSFLAVIDMIFFLATLLGNGAFVVVILVYRNMHTSSNYLLLNLAIVNGIFGSLGYAFCSILRFHYVGCNAQLCFVEDIFVYFAVTGLGMSLISFTFISVERYICIFYALKWQQILTTSRVIGAIGLIWFLLLTSLTVLYAMGFHSYFYMVYMIEIIVNVLILLATNGRIFKEIRRHEYRIAQATPQGEANSDGLRRIREKKRAKSVIIMLAIVFVCYVPTLILIVLGFISSIDQVQLQLGWMVCRSIPLTHTTFGILVYGLRTDEVKQAYRDMMDKLKITN